MVIKIWHKFLLIAVLGFMPILSHAQSCTSGGYKTAGPTTTPFSGGWKVTLTLSPTLTWSDCIIMPTQISGATSSEPITYTKNGVTVDIRNTIIRLRSGIGCASFTGNESASLFLQRCSAPQSFLVEVEYTLTGKSTTRDPNIVLFPSGLSSVTPVTTSFATMARYDIMVPVSIAPTCSFSIDQANVTLQSIKPADIENLTAGTAVASVQKNVNITANCVASTLSANATFAPQFSPTKSAVLTGSSHVALNDGTDNGVGFKLFDPSGAAITFNTPLSAFSQSLYVVTPTLPTVTKAFTIKYAKTSQAVKPGPASSSITVTFSII